MSYFVGIDLGTTYTAAAIHRNNRAQIFSLGGRSASIPSVVLLREDETVLTGDAAVRRAITEPERVAREFKRRLGDTTPIIVGGSPYSAEALMARLLKSVLEEVEKREGEPPEGIAISHPANWGLYKIDLLKQAVRLAGLNDDEVTLLTEPEAAVISYASQERVEAGEVVAVYDLGGGTFDAAVLRRTEEGFEIIGKPEGIERLGGIDFDAAVFAHVARSLDGALGKLDPDDSAAQAAMARLRQDCVDAKEALSADTDATIPVLLPNLQTDVRITRREFESLIRPSLVDSIEAMRRALVSAGVTAEEVSRVLLVGGSSRTPLIAQLVSSELGRPVAVDAHPKHAVALGAAHAAAGALGSELDTAAPAVPPTPTSPPTPTAEATPAVPPTPAKAATTATPPTPPTPTTAAPATPPKPSSIFEEPTPGVPSSSAGVPVVPSNVGSVPNEAAPKKPTPQKPAPNKPEPSMSSAKKPEPKKPPTPAAQQPTETLPTSGPPPRLVETPKQADLGLSTPHGAVKGSDAPGAPVDVSSKSRGPLIAALVGVVAVIGIGGFVISQLGGNDDGVGATGTSEAVASTSTELEDGPSTSGAVQDTTSTTSNGPATTRLDADIKADVEDALEGSVTDLQVQMTDGDAVISGWVDSNEERQVAGDAASGISGVGLVINGILVHTEDELCTDLIQSQPRWACITDAWIDVDGSVNALFESENGGTDFNTNSGFHLHVFGNGVEPINAGANGDASVGGGPWIVWDITPGFNSAPGPVFGTAPTPEKLCVRIATPRHTLESLDSGNCFPLRIEEG